MMKTDMIKTNVIFPSSLIEAIDKTVGGRKRSKFIVDAAREKIEALKFRQALETAAGCWKDERHPDLKTGKEVRAYLKKTRENTDRRLRRLID